MRLLRFFLIILFVVNMSAACRSGLPLTAQFTPISDTPKMVTLTATATPPVATEEAVAVTCLPTLDDGLSPSYTPNTPIRSSVGKGHVLTGIVRSSRDCAPIVAAMVELWPEYADQGHPDEARATIFTDQEGRYRFECNPPEHIHMRISAPGYHTIAQNSYHPDGQAEGTFDIVLVPEPP